MVYSDVSGVYSFSLNSSVPSSIFIKVYPAGENSVVRTGSNGEYVWSSNVISSITSGSITSINVDINMNTETGRAFQVSQTVIITAKYVKEMRGSDIADVTIRYPHNETNTGCFYRRSNRTVYIIGHSGHSGHRDGGIDKKRWR